MFASTPSEPSISTVLEAKRRQLATLQEEIATLERAHAILSQNGRLQSRKPSRPPAQPARPKPTKRRRSRPTIASVALETLNASKKPLSISDMYQACQARGLRISHGSLKDWVLKSHRKGLIHRVRFGLYAVAPSGTTPTTAPSAPAKASSPPMTTASARQPRKPRPGAKKA